MSKKVLFVVGSLREKSFNRTVAEYISKKLEVIEKLKGFFDKYLGLTI